MKLEDTMQTYTITITNNERAWIERALQELIDSKKYEAEHEKDNIIRKLHVDFVNIEKTIE
jgi:hypothetical protein